MPPSPSTRQACISDRGCRVGWSGAFAEGPGGEHLHALQTPHVGGVDQLHRGYSTAAGLSTPVSSLPPVAFVPPRGGLGSDSERLDDQAGSGGARVLLLAGDQEAVANRVRFEARGDDEVGAAERFRFLLDPEGLNLLSHELVDVVLLGVRESRPCLSFDKQPSVGKTRLEKRAGGMADDRERLSRLVEVAE